MPNQALEKIQRSGRESKPLAEPAAATYRTWQNCGPMSWNYRVLQRADELAIHEVFYSESGEVMSATETPVYPRAESLPELEEALARYRVALDLPVLPYDEVSTEVPDDVRVYFGVFGDWPDPGTVTAVIGRAPTSFKAIGTPVGPQSKVLMRLSSWTIKSGLPRTASVEEQLTALFDLLEPHGDGVRTAAQRYSAGIQCAAYWKTTRPGVHFSEEHIRQLAALHLSFDLDMYCLG